MKFAIICSAGGSAFFSAYDLLLQANRCVSKDFIVITDRKCDAEEAAENRGIIFKRIDFDSKVQFSKRVAKFLQEENVSAVLMLYSRLVSEELYSNIPTLNIHPALLPAFKGLNAVQQASDIGVKFIGATAHMTTEKVDDGFLIAQVVSPISADLSMVHLNQISYLQKIYLILTVLDCVWLNLLQFHGAKVIVNKAKTPKANFSANPSIQSEDIQDIFNNYQYSLTQMRYIQ